MKGPMVHHGGLMRCCLLSLSEQHDAGRLEKDIHHASTRCAYCNNPMHIVDGVWRWDMETAKKEATP